MQPKPTPRVPEPTPEPPPIQPKPEPIKPKPQPNKEDTSKTKSIVGMVIAILFILVGLGIPIVYVVYRYVFSDDDDRSPNDDTEYDDTPESTNPLDW